MDIRNASIDDFVGWPDDPPDYVDHLSSLIEKGQLQGGWLHLLYEGDTPVARIGYRLAPTISEPEWLGQLPSHQLYAIAREGTQGIKQFQAFIAATLPEDLPDDVTVLYARLFQAKHADAPSRAAELERIGFTINTEKFGYHWPGRDAGAPRPGVEFVTIDQYGVDAFTDLAGRVVEGGLDREMDFYQAHMNRRHWANEMMKYMGNRDDLRVVGTVDGDTFGFFCLSEFRTPTEATVAYIGVVPEHRGNGYSDDLLRHANQVAQRAGFTSILSDVDKQNHPMRNAMVRNGHDEDPEWHYWEYQAPLESLRANS